MKSESYSRVGSGGIIENSGLSQQRLKMVPVTHCRMVEIDMNVMVTGLNWPSTGYWFVTLVKSKKGL
jgi:hypothetical protein